MSTMILLNSLSGGGAEKAMKILASELCELRQISVVGINTSQPDEISIKCDCYVLGRNNKSGIFNTVAAIIRFRKLLRFVRPNQIIVNCALAELFAVFSPLATRMVVVEHANPAWGGRVFLGYVVRFILARRASRVVAVSSHLSFSLSKRSIDLVIPNAQKVESRNESSNLNVQNHHPKINSLAFIGRLINPQKRPEIALEVAHLAKLPITFFGEGPERVILESKSNFYSIPVDFRGFCPNVWQEIPQDCLVIVPSLFEGDGLVITEAILLERPIAVSDIPEFRRFSLPEQVYFIDAESLVEKLKSSPWINSYRPGGELRIRLAMEREPKFLARRWNELLSTL